MASRKYKTPEELKLKIDEFYSTHQQYDLKDFTDFLGLSRQQLFNIKKWKGFENIFDNFKSNKRKTYKKRDTAKDNSKNTNNKKYSNPQEIKELADSIKGLLDKKFKKDERI